MIKLDMFIAFLGYIGITNEQHQAKLYKQYQKFYCKSSYGKRQKGKINTYWEKYRSSDYKDFMFRTLKYGEDIQDKIVDYLTRSQYRDKINKEILKYSGLGSWGKEFKNEVVF